MSGFKETEFVVLDTETTGLSPRYGDRVIEIAGLRLKGLTPVGRFHSLIDPQRPVSWGAFMVNGISDAMLRGAPRAEEVLPRFMRFIQGACLVGHNLRFDMKFLSHELALIGEALEEDIPTLDTLKLARGLLPELGGYSLIHVAYALGIDTTQRHRAGEDAQLTFEVLRRLLDIAERRDIWETETLTALFGYRGGGDLRRIQEKVTALEEAIQASRPVRLLYAATSRGGITLRKVTPQRITGNGSRATLIGFCHLREEERNFKLERIIRLENAGPDNSDGEGG